MKFLLYLFIINSFSKVHTQFNAFNYIKTPNVQNNFNFYGQNTNLRNSKLQYTPNQNPLIQNQFSNNVQQQNVLNSNQRNRGTVNYQTLQYSANQNPLIQNQFTFSTNNVQKQNFLNSSPIRDQYRPKQYNTNVRQNPKSTNRSVTPVQAQVRAIGQPSSSNFVRTPQYSTIQTPKRKIQERTLGIPLSASIFTNQQYSSIPIPRSNIQGRSIGAPSFTNFDGFQQYSNTQAPKRNPQVTVVGRPSSANFVPTQQYSNIPLPNRNIQERSVGTPSFPNFIATQQFSNIQVPNRNTQGRSLGSPSTANVLGNQKYSTVQAPNRNTQGTQQYSNIAVPTRNNLGRALGRQSTTNFITPQQYSNIQQPLKRNVGNPNSPTFDSRFGADENVSNQSIHPDSFQYQYSKGWSIHEALSVDNLIKPQLEYRKNLKYSTPYTPEAQYYQKFYNIYNDVENHGRQDLIQYEKESVNDDFNGRSIVAPGQYPHMAAIGFLSNEENIDYKCGGSLISDLFVITAAHCCYLSGETPIIVKLGIINLKDQTGNSNPQRRAIKEIIVHPSYNANTTYHDIALLKLQKPVEFTKFVRPILLWTSDHIPYERVFTMGYGSTSFAKAPTNILTELSLSLIPWQKCKQSLPPTEKTPHGITETQICGRDLEKNRDTCQGDSGGPLQLNLEHRKHRNTYRYYLVGIISYGEFCGSNKPGVYTRVSSYCKWIASVVWPELFESFRK